MKKTLLLFSFLVATAWYNIHAQNVNFLDANFRNHLLADTAINTNSDSEISVAEAQAFTGTITATGLGITDLAGIEAFINITTLEVYDNNLTSLDVSNNTSLTRLHCANNQITTLDVSDIPTLNQIHCQNNQLIELNLANGNNANFSYMKSYGNPNLTCIQHDGSFYPPYTNAGQYDNGWTRDNNSNYSTNCGYEPIYVDVNATGANDGSSWTDAYTTIQDALAVASTNSRLWVAKGTYKPSAQNTPLEINATISIYGGFNGTETELSDRDVTKITTDNATIITGDMNGDDIDGDFTSNKSDNADRLILVNAVGITLDGLVLQNIYDNTSNANNQDNGVIYSKYTGAATWIENLSIKNCTFKNNYSNDFLIKGFGLKDNFKLYNVSFTNNVSVGQSIILLHVDRFNEIYANFTNVLFANNETKFSIINAYRIPNGSFTNFRELHLTLTNNSFINNNVVNTNNTSYGQCVIMGSENTWGQLFINNSIFFGNTLNGVFADRDISYGTQGNDYALTIKNSIVETSNNGGASGRLSAPSFTSVQDLDPSTVSLHLDAEYKPMSASNYILDQGNNSLYDTSAFGDLDLAGNDRIFNSSIDLGAFEYDSTLGINDVVLNKDTVKLYPNPVSDRLFITSEELIESVSIYTINGQLVKQSNTTINGIDVSNLSSGLYLLNIKSNSTSLSKKFLKH
ncbi:T9SS type A sorting domain-containing protein [Algibacter pacificus]|uniref:T9SS type A sorting domain-containing protein n=1 Tax=Algibacter pacificus TaxID=2599389 RepID=UPI0011CAD661|nr:T9SS type A sorting domain-containing protein [Algibacter pacificus]